MTCHIRWSNTRVNTSVCLCVCVQECVRERERECVCACLREWDRNVLTFLVSNRFLIWRKKVVTFSRCFFNICFLSCVNPILCCQQKTFMNTLVLFTYAYFLTQKATLAVSRTNVILLHWRRPIAKKLLFLMSSLVSRESWRDIFCKKPRY